MPCTRDADSPAEDRTPPSILPPPSTPLPLPPDPSAVPQTSHSGGFGAYLVRGRVWAAGWRLCPPFHGLPLPHSHVAPHLRVRILVKLLLRSPPATSPTPRCHCMLARRPDPTKCPHMLPFTQRLDLASPLTRGPTGGCVSVAAFAAWPAPPKASICPPRASPPPTPDSPPPVRPLACEPCMPSVVVWGGARPCLCRTILLISPSSLPPSLFSPIGPPFLASLSAARTPLPPRRCPANRAPTPRDDGHTGHAKKKKKKKT
jgi:hypothetical protein